TNAGPEYFKAEKEYLNSQNPEDKQYWLEEMIKHCPKHKSSEKMLSELRIRLKKLKSKIEKSQKKSKGKKGIRKEGFQFVLIGFTNTGKSSLLIKLTNARPLVAEHPFTTIQPEIGTFYHEGIKAQIIDQPSLGSENFDSGLANNADCLIYVIESFNEILNIDKQIPRTRGKKIIVINKADLLNNEQKRKVEATIKSKRLPGLLISTINNYNIEELRSMLFEETGMIRIYMKEPHKPASPKPLVLSQGATVKDVAESILKGFSSKVKETKITGPSSKFPNQKVGLTHKLKDKDIIEFHTR
ncbi:MAG: GTPase, partial [Nanoarchaeota archaeon]